MEPKKYSAVVKWSLIIGIVIVLNLFFNYLISLVYPSPDYNVFCEQKSVIELNTKTACVENGGQWTDTIAPDFDVPPVKEGFVASTKGYCDPYFTCQKNYDNAYKIYNRNIFIALVIIGVILFALSFPLAFNNILSVSFSMGGILSIIVASVRYWSDADNLVRVVILFLALAALIYFAVRKFKN